MTELMDHSPSIITQVSREEEENATCREEGEFGGEKFYRTAELRMSGAAGRDGTVSGRPSASLLEKRAVSFADTKALRKFEAGSASRAGHCRLRSSVRDLTKREKVESVQYHVAQKQDFNAGHGSNFVNKPSCRRGRGRDLTGHCHCLLLSCFTLFVSLQRVPDPHFHTVITR